MCFYVVDEKKNVHKNQDLIRRFRARIELFGRCGRGGVCVYAGFFSLLLLLMPLAPFFIFRTQY